MDNQSVAQAPRQTCEHLEVNDLLRESLVLAAAGRHNLLITENNGRGMARKLAEVVGHILPPLTDEQAEETARIFEQAKETAPGGHKVPVRVVPSYMSLAGMIGGGRPVRPGEVSLAHNGVLVVDELQEFSSRVLDHIASVTGQGDVRLVRVDGTYCFPADSLLVGTANPLPGGARSYGECSAGEIRSYRERCGNRLMEQFEISCQMPEVDLFGQLVPMWTDGDQTVVQEMQDQVMAAREFKEWREAHDIDVMRSMLDGSSRVRGAGCAPLDSYGNGLQSSQFYTVLAVARTAADIAGREEIAEEDVMKALALRVVRNDRNNDYMPKEFRGLAWSEERGEEQAVAEHQEPVVRDEEGR